MRRDMVCVYHAADIGEADIVAAWLEDRGIRTHVKDRFAAGTFQTSLIVAPRGIEVCVLDASQADRAKELLTERQEEIAAARRAGEEGPSIEAICEDCGQATCFPSAKRGSVQNCPHCGNYMDVPEEDET